MNDAIFCHWQFNEETHYRISCADSVPVITITEPERLYKDKSRVNVFALANL